MSPSKLPLSVLLALGLVSCGEPDAEDEGDARPCLSVMPDPEVVGPCLSPPDDPPPEPPPVEDPEAIPELEKQACLTLLPEPEPEPEPEPVPDVCLSVMPDPDPDTPLRPCLSIRPPLPPPDPEASKICLSEDLDPEPEAAEDGGSDLGNQGVDEHLAVLERLEDRLPEDVRRRL